MSMPDNISNILLYNDKMAKSVSDKLFFTNKIYDFNQVVDFGCADGSLIKEIYQKTNGVELIGYDISKNMLEIARKENSMANYFNEWDDIKVRPNSLLNLSSVIHEVYSYSKANEIRRFWSRVFNSGFKYIVIRDMFVSKKTLVKTDVEDEKKVRKISNKYILKSFESRNGSIKVLRNFIHYLLKYSYTDNWKRENNENYLPLFYEDLLSIIPESFDVLYQDNFVLPYLQDKIVKDFDVVLNEFTHMKLILRKKQTMLSSPVLL